jgi:hypothetical protein
MKRTIRLSFLLITIVCFVSLAQTPEQFCGHSS